MRHDDWEEVASGLLLETPTGYQAHCSHCPEWIFRHPDDLDACRIELTRHLTVAHTFFPPL